MLNGNNNRWLAILGTVAALAVAIVTIIEYLLPNSSSPSDFSISVNPMLGSAQNGAVIQSKVTLMGAQGYKYAITLSGSGQPSDIVVTFSPKSGEASPEYVSDMMISVGSRVPPGDHAIIVKGLGADGKEHSCKYILTTSHIDNPRPSPPQPTTYPFSPSEIQSIQNVIKEGKRLIADKGDQLTFDEYEGWVDKAKNALQEVSDHRILYAMALFDSSTMLKQSQVYLMRQRLINSLDLLERIVNNKINITNH